MVQLLVERAWAKLHAIFPERQIYIRSEGRVRFFTFSSNLQAACAAVCLVFVGWVAFTSANVVLRDRALAATDHHFHKMQGAYESRVADLQLSYNELNEALVSAEGRFKSTVDELAAKQRSIAGLIRGKAAEGTFELLPSNRGIGRGLLASDNSRMAGKAGVSSDSIDAVATGAVRSPAYSPSVAPSVASHGSGSSELGIMPEPVEPQPRTARPVQASLFGGALLQLFQTPAPNRTSLAPPPTLNTRELALLAQQTQRAARISRSETALVVAFDGELLRQIGAAKSALAHAGIDSSRALGDVRVSGVGGPAVPLQSVRMREISDSAFVSAYADATAREAELASLTAALSHVPLAMPVRVGQFSYSSGFGPRVDPFSGRVAFHSGVDLAGPWGAGVYATAAGVVDWAGVLGGYGNMVEVDHGLGFRTRYGHLSAIEVRPGEKVVAGTLLGRVGSTGRSTGPHLHYEVWLADSAKDPDKYLEMGRRLLE